MTSYEVCLEKLYGSDTCVQDVDHLNFLMYIEKGNFRT